MIQHRNGKFICADRVALTLPNNVFIDFNPPVIPVEGMIFYSSDQKITMDVNLLETDEDAHSFLLRVKEDYETFRIVKPVRHVSVGNMEGYGMTYALSSEVMEEYVLTVPGEVPALFNICLAQEIGDLSERDYYVKLRDELLKGVEVV